MWYNFIVAPLAQFDIIQNTVFWCCYDVFWPVGGRWAVTTVILGLGVWGVWGWQYYNFNRTDTKVVYPLIDFDDEVIVFNALAKKNSRWGDWGGLLFGYIFCFNFLGLFPFTLTMTAQLVFTVILAVVGVFIVWAYGIYHNKILALNHFLPMGAPLFLAPFIIIIELISNFSRLVSLPVRLFANITSGHALLKILAEAATGLFLCLLGFVKGSIVVPICVIIVISVLEVIIAFLQAYVFVTLLLIYVSEIQHEIF